MAERKPCRGGSQSKLARDGGGEKKTTAILSKKMVVNTRARKPMVNWRGSISWGDGGGGALVCYYRIRGERAEVERVAEEKERRGTIAEPEFWRDRRGRDLSTSGGLVAKGRTVSATSSAPSVGRVWSQDTSSRTGRAGCWRGSPNCRKIPCLWKISLQGVSASTANFAPTHGGHFPVHPLRCLPHFWKALWEIMNSRIVVWMTGLIVSFGNVMRPWLFKSLQLQKVLGIFVLLFSVARYRLSNVCLFTQLAPAFRSQGQRLSVLNNI